VVERVDMRAVEGIDFVRRENGEVWEVFCCALFLFLCLLDFSSVPKLSYRGLIDLISKESRLFDVIGNCSDNEWKRLVSTWNLNSLSSRVYI
jgi:hypothetical protein